MNIVLYIIQLLSVVVSGYCLSTGGKQAIQECLEEFKITKDELDKMRKQKSPELDCFTACIMKKRGNMKDGKIDLNNIVETLKQFHVLNKQRTEEKSQRCAAAANTQSNECLVARDMIGCLYYEASSQR